MKGIYVRGIDSNFGKTPAEPAEAEEETSTRRTAVKVSGKAVPAKGKEIEGSTIYTIEAEDMKLCHLETCRKRS